jgi:cell division protein ZapB
MATPDIKALERLVDELIVRNKRLTDENRALRHQHSHLLSERATLIEKTESARARVEAMIARLKSMET